MVKCVSWDKIPGSNLKVESTRRYGEEVLLMVRCKVCHKEIQTDSIASGKCIYCRMRAELALWASTPKQARRIMQMSNAQIMVAMKKVSATFTTIINSSMITYNAILEAILQMAQLLRQAYKEALKNEEFAKIAEKYKIEPLSKE